MKTVEVRSCKVTELDPKIRQLVMDQLLEGNEPLLCCERIEQGKFFYALVVTKTEIFQLVPDAYEDDVVFASVYIKDVVGVSEESCFKHEARTVVIHAPGRSQEAIKFMFVSKEQARWFIRQLRHVIRDTQFGQSNDMNSTD